MANLIGFTGAAQAGKDTAAQALIDIGYKRISFADTLRTMLYLLDPIVHLPEYNHYVRLRSYVNSVGWDEAKRLDDIRGLLQRLGTEAGREILGNDIWVKTAFRAFDKFRAEFTPLPRAVVTDVRFDNEAEAIISRGGIILKVERPGYGPINSHTAERGIDEKYLSGILHNKGTIQFLSAQVLVAVSAVETARNVLAKQV